MNHKLLFKEGDRKILKEKLRQLVRFSTETEFAQHFGEIFEWLYEREYREYADYLRRCYADRAHEW